MQKSNLPSSYKKRGYFLSLFFYHPIIDPSCLKNQDSAASWKALAGIPEGSFTMLQGARSSKAILMRRDLTVDGGNPHLMRRDRTVRDIDCKSDWVDLHICFLRFCWSEKLPNLCQFCGTELSVVIYSGIVIYFQNLGIGYGGWRHSNCKQLQFQHLILFEAMFYWIYVF